MLEEEVFEEMADAPSSAPKAKAMPTKPKALPKKRPIAPSIAPIGPIAPSGALSVPRPPTIYVPSLLATAKAMVAKPKATPKPPTTPPPPHLKEEAKEQKAWDDEEEDFVEEEEEDQWNGWQDWKWNGEWDQDDQAQQDWKRRKIPDSGLRWQDGKWERASTNGVSPKKSPKSTEKTQKPQKTQYPQYVKAVSVKNSTSAWARGRNATRGRPKRQKFPDAPERWGEDWEQSRQEVDLTLLGQMGPPTSRWEYRLVDESRRSFLGYMPSAFSTKQCDTLFEQVKECTQWQTPPDSGPAPRQVAWMTKKGCSCKYRYGGVELESQEFPQQMQELLGRVMKLCGGGNADWPDSCSLNFYEDGAASLGWHADDEALFQGKFEDIRIISLSLGQARTFELRRNWPQAGETEVQKLRLSSGDIMTMEGMMQKHFQHRIPKEGCVEPRINLTWRWIRKHYPECPAFRGRR